MEYIKLSTAQEIDGYINELKKNGRTTIAVDFEGEFNLHVYGEKLCLIQIYDESSLIIIDPIEADLNAVRRLFEDEKIMKLMWGAQSDISLIVNGYSMMMKSVLDLRPAADLLELPKKDYASVTSEILGIKKQEGKSRFQKYNWMRRPLDRDAVEYALNDVLHLHALKDAFLSQLSEKGLLSEFIRLNLIIQNRNYVRVPGQRHKKMKGYKYLKHDEKKLLKSLFDLRDGFAKDLNWPPHRVIQNPDLMDLAAGNITAAQIRFDRRLNNGRRQEIGRAVDSVL